MYEEIRCFIRLCDLLKKFNIDDLDKLWNLVKERFRTIEPTEDKARELWVEFKRLFEPDDNDTLWKLQRYMHDPLKWWLIKMAVVFSLCLQEVDLIFTCCVERIFPDKSTWQNLMLCCNKL
ncbi:hypothetical protein Tco_0744515 [Tanacetum coccineum]